MVGEPRLTGSRWRVTRDDRGGWLRRDGHGFWFNEKDPETQRHVAGRHGEGGSADVNGSRYVALHVRQLVTKQIVSETIIERLIQSNDTDNTQQYGI